MKKVLFIDRDGTLIVEPPDEQINSLEKLEFIPGVFTWLLRVGTCAPGPGELRGVRCNLLDLCDPGEPFTAADWLSAARACLERLGASGARAVVTGGTGLYISALVDGFDLARVPPDAARRADRTAVAASPGGLETLGEELRRRDPEGAATIDRRNPRRVIRALEILDTKGGSVLTARGRSEPHDALMIGLDVDRAVHARWIEHRVTAMFDGDRLQDEVRRLLELGLDRPGIVGCGIGYREALDLVEGRTDVDAAKQETVRRTLRYARAQRTWFRRDSRISWLRPDLVGFEGLVAEAVERFAGTPA